MDGVFLSPPEDEFVGRIAEELEHFMVQGQQHRVLLFPPLSSRLRYLIHRTVENMDLLSSFSVGEGWRRRTVICHSAVRLPGETTSDPKPGANPARPPRPAQPWGRGGRGLRLRPPGDTHGDPPRGSVGSGRITRPPRRKADRALYVPRGGRRKANWREREAEPGGDAAQGAGSCPRNSQQEAGKAGDSPGGGPGKQQEPGEEIVSGEAGAEHPPRHENAAPAGSGGDCCEQEGQGGDCAASLAAGHPEHPPEAAEQRSGHASPAAPEGSGFPAQPREESAPGRDARGSGRGESSSGSWTEAATAESPLLENQGAAATSPESSRKQSPAGEQHEDSGSAQGSLSTPGSQEQRSPGGARGEQSPLQNLVQAPGEALAAPELLPGGDPSAPEGAPGQSCPGKVPGEEEEDEDAAEALWKGQGLAAGDAEGTRQSGLEDDCTAELLAEIVGNLRVKDISIERVSVDLCSPGEAQLSEGDLGHVTEIYDFPSSLKTEDLLEIFSDFHESGFKIQWVDDTHALGIFSSLSTASQALGRRYPCLKIRPLIHATKQSKIRALQRPKLLHLGKERPQTDTAVARRLVSHALGWKKQQEPSGTEVFQAEPLDQEE